MKGTIMTEKMISLKVFRFDPSVDQEPWYQTYQVPLEKGMSTMTALDYIYQNLDGSLAYYDHAACDLGICARCTGRRAGASISGRIFFTPAMTTG